MIVLIYYRFNRGKPLAWKDILKPLDGATLHFSQPRNHFSSDVCLPDSNTIPFFATAKVLPEFMDDCRRGDMMEDELLRVRFRIFVFSKARPTSEIKDCAPCEKCFAQFLLGNAECE